MSHGAKVRERLRREGGKAWKASSYFKAEGVAALPDERSRRQPKKKKTGRKKRS